MEGCILPLIINHLAHTTKLRYSIMWPYGIVWLVCVSFVSNVGVAIHLPGHVLSKIVEVV